MLFGKTQQVEFGFGRLLVQPTGFCLQNHVDAGRTVFALVDQELLEFGYRLVVGESVDDTEFRENTLIDISLMRGQGCEAIGEGVGDAEFHEASEVLHVTKFL